MDMTKWLKENVKEEKYMVLKVEAKVLEEMMRSKSIKMVDELFLECKPKGLGLRGRKMQNKSGRAYWECLALYGKLRDEGVAVHQWWGGSLLDPVVETKGVDYASTSGLGFNPRKA